MYAVIKTGGKQYRVEKDSVIAIEKLDKTIGDKVEFEVIALGKGKEVIVDKESLGKARVSGQVIDQVKSDKVTVFKFKKRKGYKRLRGHRQNLTKVKITKIAS